MCVCILVDMYVKNPVKLLFCIPSLRLAMEKLPYATISLGKGHCVYIKYVNNIETIVTVTL